MMMMNSKFHRNSEIFLTYAYVCQKSVQSLVLYENKTQDFRLLLPHGPREVPNYKGNYCRRLNNKLPKYSGKFMYVP